MLLFHPQLSNGVALTFFVARLAIFRVANGTTIGSAIDSGELLARIQITAVPEPTTVFLAALGGLIFLVVVRRKSPR